MRLFVRIIMLIHNDKKCDVTDTSHHSCARVCDKVVRVMIVDADMASVCQEQTECICRWKKWAAWRRQWLLGCRN